MVPDQQFQKYKKENTKGLLLKTSKKAKTELNHSLITLHKNTKYLKRKLLKQIKIKLQKGKRLKIKCLIYLLIFSVFINNIGYNYYYL